MFRCAVWSARRYSSTSGPTIWTLVPSTRVAPPSFNFSNCIASISSRFEGRCQLLQPTHRRPRQPPLAAGLILGARSRLRPMTAPHLPNGRAQDSRSFQSALSAPAFGDSRPRKRAARPHPSYSDAATCLNDVMKDTHRFSRARRPVGAPTSTKPPGKGKGRMSPESPFLHFSNPGGPGGTSAPFAAEPPHPLTVCYGPGLAFAGAAR